MITPEETAGPNTVTVDDTVPAEPVMTEAVVTEILVTDTVVPETAPVPETVAQEETAVPETAAETTEAPTTDAALPLANYDQLSLPSLRARLRTLSAPQVAELLAYEKSHADRGEIVTMFERRVAKLEAEA